MKKSSVVIGGKRYTVQAGDIFQMPYRNPTVHQIFISAGELNETLYFEVLERVNASLAIVRVNEIHRFIDGKREVETYENAIVGPMVGELVSTNIDKMTKKELIEFAEKNNIKIDKRCKKANILNSIKEQL